MRALPAEHFCEENEKAQDRDRYRYRGREREKILTQLQHCTNESIKAV